MFDAVDGCARHGVPESRGLEAGAGKLVAGRRAAARELGKC